MRDLPNVIIRVFRENYALALRIKDIIHKFADDIRTRRGKEFTIKIMNFCGTHEWTTVHYGIRTLMPESVDLVAGPGCPVCITPAYYIDVAIRLAMDGIIVYTYGDTYRLPTVSPVDGSSSLAQARAKGCDVRVVYSFLDAVSDARSHGKDSVFLGIGFETIAPIYAKMFSEGKVPKNLKFLNVIRLTPPAAAYTIETCSKLEGESVISGIIAPGHVSTITGAVEWDVISRRYSVPVVISGFEPIDVLMSIAEILRQLRAGEHKTVIQYRRAVTWDGNVKFKQMAGRIFDKVSSAWRGIGFIPSSGLKLKDKLYDEYDALNYFGIPDLTPSTWRYDLPRGCRCADIMLGRAKPTDCPMYLRACRPESPRGPCMVSMEGTCSIWARYGRKGFADIIAKELGLIK